MNSIRTRRVCGTISLLVLLLFFLWLWNRPDPRIEALLEFDRPDAAIDDEVVLAELPLLDQRAIHRLADELFRPDGMTIRVNTWLRKHFPALASESMPMTSGYERRARALRVLTLLAERAHSVAGRIATLATNRNSVYSMEAAIALATIQGIDPASITNIYWGGLLANQSQLSGIYAQWAQIGE